MLKKKEIGCLLQLLSLPFIIGYQLIVYFIKFAIWVFRLFKNDNMVNYEKPYTQQRMREPLNTTSLSISGSIQQVLETLEIMDNSKNIDVVTSRGKFLGERLNFLKEVRLNSTYLFDLQRGVENYKALYYDKIPKELHLFCITQPHDFDLIDYYSQSVFMAYKRYTDMQFEQIALLKREGAKLKRKGKLLELTDIVIGEVLPCVSYSKIHQEIRRIQANINAL